MSAIRPLLLLSGVLLLAGCECGTGTQRTFGDGAWLPDEGVTIAGGEATLDFGWVRYGDEATRVIRLTNHGTGAVALRADAVTNGALTWPALDASVAPGEVAEWPLHFRPTDDGGESGRRDFSATVDVRAEGGTKAQTLRLRLYGRGYATHCLAPEDIDFHTVLVGDTPVVELTLSNPTPGDVVAELQPPIGGDSAAFHWEAETLPLPSGTSAVARLTFTPTEARAYSSLTRLRVSADCPLQTIELRGRAVRSFLTWQPVDIDCGWVPVSAARHVPVEFRNTGPAPIEVRDFTTTGPVEGPTQPLMLPPEGALTTEVVCRPSALGRQTGALHFTTSLDSTPEGAIPVQVKGGGPRISVTPVPLGFGRVAWAENGAPTSTRRLVIRNVGVLPADAGNDGNLHLATDDAGVPTVAFYESDGGVSAADVHLAPGAYDAEVGLRPRPGESLTVDVTLKPPALGPLGFELGVASDDALTPEVRVPVTAHAEVLPPCLMAVSPTTLEFGLVYPDESRTADVTLTNLRVQPGEDCLLSAIDVASPFEGAFALPGGRIESLVLHAGETQTLPVSALHVDVPGPKQGTLGFEVSSTVQPTRAVALTSFSNDECGVVLPSPLDIGLVPVGCTSLRPVTVYNMCAAPLTVQGVTSSQPEFASDAGVATLATTESVSLDISFSPHAVGPHAATLAVGMAQSATQSVRLVDVSGTGIPLQEVTESFTQPPVHQVDVLIITELLESTLDEFPYTFMAIAAGDAMEGLRDAGVDLHVGVVASAWDRREGEPLGVRGVFEDTGELVPLLNIGKYATSTSPALGAAVRDAILKPWGNGVILSDGWDIPFEATLRALTPPLSTTANVGFRRPDAQLAVILAFIDNDSSRRYRPPVLPYPLSIPPSASYYYARIAEAAGGPALLTVNTVARTQACYEYADRYGRLATMTQLSGGVLIDGCTTDFPGVFGTIQQTVLATNQRFTLRGRPNTSQPMSVSIDGQAQAASSWQYDSIRNQLVFTTAPPPNAHIAITYFPACG